MNLDHQKLTIQILMVFYCWSTIWTSAGTMEMIVQSIWKIFLAFFPEVQVDSQHDGPDTDGQLTTVDGPLLLVNSSQSIADYKLLISWIMFDEKVECYF